MHLRFPPTFPLNYSVKGIEALCKTQVEVTSIDRYEWPNSFDIYGSDTKMDTGEADRKTQEPGQVNNVYIFPGTSAAAICCLVNLCYHLTYWLLVL